MHKINVYYIAIENTLSRLCSSWHSCVVGSALLARKRLVATNAIQNCG